MANPNWVKGKSGNPGTMFKAGQQAGPGRPRKLPITKALEKILELQIGKKVAARANLQSTDTFAEAIAMAALSRAVLGDINAIKLLLEHIEGKPLQRLRVEGAVDGRTLEQVKEEIMALTKRIRERQRLNGPIIASNEGENTVFSQTTE